MSNQFISEIPEIMTIIPSTMRELTCAHHLRKIGTYEEETMHTVLRTVWTSHKMSNFLSLSIPLHWHLHRVLDRWPKGSCSNISVDKVKHLALNVRWVVWRKCNLRTLDVSSLTLAHSLTVSPVLSLALSLSLSLVLSLSLSLPPPCVSVFVILPAPQ